MKKFCWNTDKNIKLKNERGVSFEEVEQAIKNGNLLDILQNSQKYPNQFMFIVCVNHYPCRVPFVENDEEIFLKTIIPDRKLKSYYGDCNE